MLYLWDFHIYYAFRVTVRAIGSNNLVVGKVFLWTLVATGQSQPAGGSWGTIVNQEHATICMHD